METAEISILTILVRENAWMNPPDIAHAPGSKGFGRATVYIFLDRLKRKGFIIEREKEGFEPAYNNQDQRIEFRITPKGQCALHDATSQESADHTPARF